MKAYPYEYDTTIKIPKKFSIVLMILSFFLLTLFQRGKSDDPNYVGFKCPNEAYSYTTGSSFEGNLNDTLFTHLVVNASRLPFSTYTTGLGIDRVYALYYCRGDISIDSCHDCVQFASRKILQTCSHLKEGIVWFEECTLRYANYSIFSFTDDDVGLNYPNYTQTSVYSDYLDQYQDTFDGVMRGVIDQTVNNTSLFATRKVNLSSALTLTGLAQCAPVISGAPCERCLTVAFRQLNLWANNMMFLPTCFVGFEIDGSPPPPPSLDSSSFPVRYKILIAVLAVVVAISLLTGVLYWRRCSQGDQNLLSNEERYNDLNVLNEHVSKADELLYAVVSSRYDGETLNAAASIEDNLERRRQHGLIKFTYCQLEGMTRGFERKIGEGGYAEVYHGRLSDDQSEVAIKVFSKNDSPKQFSTEIEVLGRISHKNLVSLIGYCEEGTNLALIYEYMAKGDLKAILSEHPDDLTWKKRIEIAIDTAQGLDYLHHGCSPPIVHRDVKTANILLNEDFRAKVADFGFSKIFPAEYVSNLHTRVIGTLGYLDPQYNLTGQLNEKGDVYSFGIVLLELITGKLPILKKDMNLGQWVKMMVQRGDIVSILDPRLQKDLTEADANYITVWKTVELAMKCVEMNIIERPRMSQIVVQLKECSTLMNTRTSGSTPISMEIMSPTDSANTMSPTPR